MLLRHAGLPLSEGCPERMRYDPARFRRFNNVGYHAFFGRLVGAFKLFAVLGAKLCSELLRIFRRFKLFAVKYVDRALCAHNGNFRRRPCEDHVGAHIDAAHGKIRAAVCLAHYESNLRDCRRRVCKQHLRSVADNAAALLGETRHKSGNVHEVHNRNVKFVAGADKARSLVRGVDVEAAGLVGGLVSNYARHYSLESGKADYYIAGWRSSLATKCMLPETVACASAVANISSAASSPVAALMTCGPQIKRLEFFLVIMMKSIRAGL